MNSTVVSMAVFDDDGPGPRQESLFVGGFFTWAGGEPTSPHIARWDGQQWHPVGAGVSGGPGAGVDTLAVFDEDGPGPNPGGLYAGGLFLNAGSVEARHIARWGCPLAPPCDANCNKDFNTASGVHVLNVRDFGCFQTRYVLSDPYADCNGDGQLTPADFGCFQSTFVLDCP